MNNLFILTYFTNHDPNELELNGRLQGNQIWRSVFVHFSNRKKNHMELSQRSSSPLNTTPHWNDLPRKHLLHSFHWSSGRVHCRAILVKPHMGLRSRSLTLGYKKFCNMFMYRSDVTVTVISPLQKSRNQWLHDCLWHSKWGLCSGVWVCFTPIPKVLSIC